MGNLLGNNNQAEKLFSVKVNNSELGHALTVVMGTNVVNQNLFWIDGFSDQAISKKSGGGGKGGKSGQYVYYADVVAGLCAGPINGIGDIWTGQSWLGSPTASETYAITSPYTYTPANASSLQNDYGVSPAISYSSTTNDFGAPSSTSLSASMTTPFTKVAYGTTLASGQYSVNPSTGAYNFSSADNGRSVTLYYSYLLTNINEQEQDIIPSGRTISVGGTFAFQSDLGVVYGGTGANAGQALTRVSGTPSATGTYSVSGSAPATYHFAAGDIGAQVIITFQINNPSAVGQGESTMLDFTVANGAIGQSPFSFLSSSYPGAAIGYSGVACVLYQPMDLGDGAEPQENRFEVVTGTAFGGGILDANPVTCLTEVLTNTQWGLGVGAVPFPTTFIDTNTWGIPGTPGAQQTGATAWNWFAANGFFISPVLDSQDTAASTMSKWLEAGMCAAFVSEGLLKLVPYGDTSVAANGCTWTAPSTYVVALDDTCFIAKEGEDPVKITRSPWQDAYNSVQIQWDNRKNQYSQEITEESDQALINRFGSRIEDPQDFGFITTLTAATFAANMRLKRGTTIRNTYEFTLPYTYGYLEPMDLCVITTSSVWAMGLNNQNLGLSSLPVRITKIVDDPVEGLHVTAEDYPYGAGQPVIFNKGLNTSEPVSNTFAYPGTSEVVLFEAAGRLTNYFGNQLWLGANGTGDDYGATNVWASQDGTTYVQVTQAKAPAVLGTLASTYASGSDPDTANSLVVTLAENCPPLASGTTGGADNNAFLCYVNGEIISYSACALTGQNTYTMSGYIRRGLFGTPISSHAAGSPFMRLDGAVVKYTYDPSWQGKTVYFKFQPVNRFGNNPTPLSSLTAVSFTLANINTGVTTGASSGLNSQGSIIPTQPVVLTATFTSTSITMTWTAQSMLRADGSTLNIPSGSASWTGLSASTAYYIYPAVNAITGAITFTNPNPPTTSPSSTYAIQSGADGLVSLPAFTVTTSATGGGGGGSFGGGGVCPEGAELIDVQGQGIIPAINVQAGDFIRGKCIATGEDVYRKVVATEHIACVAWQIVNGHRISPCEAVNINGDWMPAYRAPGATLDTTSGTKVHITVDCGAYDEANYYLVNGDELLIHNYTVSTC